MSHGSLELPVPLGWNANTRILTGFKRCPPCKDGCLMLSYFCVLFWTAARRSRHVSQRTRIDATLSRISGISIIIIYYNLYSASEWVCYWIWLLSPWQFHTSRLARVLQASRRWVTFQRPTGKIREMRTQEKNPKVTREQNKLASCVLSDLLSFVIMPNLVLLCLSPKEKHPIQARPKHHALPWRNRLFVMSMMWCQNATGSFELHGGSIGHAQDWGWMSSHRVQMTFLLGAEKMLSISECPTCFVIQWVSTVNCSCCYCPCAIQRLCSLVFSPRSWCGYTCNAWLGRKGMWYRLIMIYQKYQSNSTHSCYQSWQPSMMAAAGASLPTML